MDQRVRSSSEREDRPLILAGLIGLFAAYVFVAVSQRVVLWSDGSFQFLDTLLKPFAPAEVFEHPMRTGGAVIMRLPTTIALWSGVRSLTALYWFFGFGLFMHYAVMFGVCWKVTEGRREFMVYPLASFFFVSANISFFTWTPSHFLVSTFWSLLFVLILPRRWSLGWFLVALALVLAGITAYESVVVLGPVLVIAALFRCWRETSRWLRAGAGVIAVLCLGGAVVAASSVTDRGVGHFTSFGLPFVAPGGFLHGSAMLSLVGMGLLATVDMRPRRTWLVGFSLWLAACIGWIGLIAMEPGRISVFVHYMARTLNLSFVLVLACLFLHSVITASRRAESWRRCWEVLTVAALMQFAWMNLAASHWSAYLRLLAQEGQQSQGLVAFEDTRMGEFLVDGHPVAAFNWAWTVPVLSLLTAPHGNVRAIVASPTSYEGWLPFDPSIPDSLPRLEAFGVRYDEYIAALDSLDSSGAGKR